MGAIHSQKKKKMGGGGGGVSHFQSLYTCTNHGLYYISGGGGGGKLRYAIITTTIEAQESFITRQISPRPARYIIVVMSDLQSLQSKLSIAMLLFVQAKICYFPLEKGVV